ncbi:Uncharacterized protein FWK35_00035485, partial [Aphis craccivora]
VSQQCIFSYKTSIHTGQLKLKPANDTADFLLELNNTFDACNSQNLYDKNPNRRYKHIPGINHISSIIRILGIRNMVTTTYLDITAYQVETTYKSTMVHLVPN